MTIRFAFKRSKLRRLLGLRKEIAAGVAICLVGGIGFSGSPLLGQDGVAGESESVVEGDSELPAFDVEEADFSTLDTQVITATRGVEDAYATPFIVDVISRREIEEKLYRNLTESLVETPGVMVQKTANGQSSPYIRGFTGNRTLALIDGVRYNNSVYRDGPNEYFSMVDVYAVDSIELVKGPGSVNYGSDAVGGTLNLLTKHADFLIEPGGAVFHHASSLYRYSSAEQSHMTRIEYQTGVGGEWGIHLGFSGKDFGNVRAADLGEQLFTGYDEYAYDLRFDAALGDDWTLTVAHQALEQDDVWRTHSTIYGVSFAGTEVGSDLRRLKDQQRSLTYAKLKRDDFDGVVDAATVTASYQTFDEDGERVRKDGRGLLEGFDSAMWGIDLQLESGTPIGWLTYGFDYYEDHVDSSRRDFAADGSLDRVRVQGPVGDDSVYGQLGIYLQDEIALHDRVELLLGGRYTSVDVDIGRFEDPHSGEAASYSDRFDHVVGSGRLIVDLDDEDRFKLYGGIGQSFRAPNLADLSRLGASRSDQIESAATDLEPEEFLTYEVGVKTRSWNLSGVLAWFYTDIDHAIARTPTGRLIDDQREVTKQNSASGYVQGIEASLDYELGGGFSVFVNGAWVEGEVDGYPYASSPRAVREPMSRVQPIVGSGGVRWTHPDQRFWTELSLTIADDADRLSRSDRNDVQRIPPGGTPGYELLNLRAGWDIGDHGTLTVGLENLLDEAYRVHGSGSNEPGFGLVLGLELAF